MDRLIMATNNEDKLREMRELFNDLHIAVLGLKDVFSEPVDIVEDGETFQENALIKAETISKMCHEVVIADDSGLVIDALGGRPGVQSARFLGHDTDYRVKNQKILEMLEGVTDRSARYVCAMAIAFPNRESMVFEETMEGEIALSAQGDQGFGYDPIFYFPPLGKTNAMISLEEKNRYSHRAKAARHILEIVKDLKDE